MVWAGVMGVAGKVFGPKLSDSFAALKEQGAAVVAPKAGAQIADSTALPASLAPFKGKVEEMYQDQDVIRAARFADSLRTVQNESLEYMANRYKIKESSLLTASDREKSPLSNDDKKILADLQSVEAATLTRYHNDIKDIAERKYGLKLDSNAVDNLKNHLDAKINNYPAKAGEQQDAGINQAAPALGALTANKAVTQALEQDRRENLKGKSLDPAEQPRGVNILREIQEYMQKNALPTVPYFPIPAGGPSSKTSPLDQKRNVGGGTPK